MTSAETSARTIHTRKFSVNPRMPAHHPSDVTHGLRQSGLRAVTLPLSLRIVNRRSLVGSVRSWLSTLPLSVSANTESPLNPFARMPPLFDDSCILPVRPLARMDPLSLCSSTVPVMLSMLMPSLSPLT